MSSKVVAVVGSYRKGGMIDQAVEAVLAGAREKGAETHKIYLADQHIEFCSNCRQCEQTPGPERGMCVQHDDLEPMLEEIEAADAVVLGSPVNYYNATALFRKFMERLIGYTYWPWGKAAPSERTTVCKRRAVLVASAAMPGFCIPLLTGTAKALRLTARMLGARPVGRLWIGFAAGSPNPVLSPGNLKRARQMGMRLA